MVVESEVVEESGVHHHRPHDVNAAEDDRAVDGATGDAEAVDAANDRESYKDREWLGWGLHGTLVAYLLLFPSRSPRFDSWPSQEFFSRCCQDLLTPLLRTVDRRLILSFESIFYWTVAS